MMLIRMLESAADVILYGLCSTIGLTRGTFIQAPSRSVFGHFWPLAVSRYGVLARSVRCMLQHGRDVHKLLAWLARRLPGFHLRAVYSLPILESHHLSSAVGALSQHCLQCNTRQTQN